MANETLIKVFEDTRARCLAEPDLINAINNTIAKTVCYVPSEDSADIKPADKSVELKNVHVTRNKTITAALNLAKKYNYTKKVGILNFASATNPGGGVTRGTSAQEESICRCSTLQRCLISDTAWNIYYAKNRANANPLHTSDVLFTPDILIFKDDNFKAITPVAVDVLTCAAPNLRPDLNNRYNQEGNCEAVTISDEELYKLHVQRASSIIWAAIANHDNILVLGAFGCGVFRNNPRVVAQAYKDVLTQWASYFDEIEFAIYCRDYETYNYEVFKEILQ